MISTNETQQIISQIEFAARGRSNKDITKLILEEWRNGEKANIITDMLEANKYFLCRNTSIQKKSRDYVDADGARQINDTLSNAKIPSAFVRDAVIQKVNYAVGKPFAIDVISPVGENENLAKQYLEEWTKWITPDIRKTIKRISTNAVNKGIGWAHVTIRDGQLVIEDAEPEQIYPAWSDKAHAELDAIVRDYAVVVFEGMTRTTVNKVEYWDSKTVERYIESNNELYLDTEQNPISGHLELLENKLSWGKVPFVALKGNDDELPQLNVIRQQVDAYDALNSKSVDALLDDIDPVLALEGYSPELGDLQKIRLVMQSSRIIAIGEKGKIHYVQVNLNITAVETKLDSLRKDIRQFGQMIISQENDMTSNPSGIALKFRYQDLDTYIDGFEPNFEAFMYQLKYFFDRWLEFKRIGVAEQWKDYKLIVTLNRDMMINESQYIDDTVKLMATNVSQETINNYNPAVESHAIEQERRNKEQEQALSDNDMLRKIAETQGKNK